MIVEVTRDLDAKRINKILNDPDVRPFVADAAEGEIDMTLRMSERNYCLVGEHGACFLYCLGTGLYEVHTQVTRAGRGEWAKAFVLAARDYMFTKTPGLEGMTRVPRGHIAAKALALTAGFQLEFTRPLECHWREHVVDVDVYNLTIHRWVAVTDHLEATGDWFHEKLHAAAELYGVKDPAHPEDKNHNRYVGAAIEMIMGGQVAKGVNWYNRWAVVSRHDPIRIVCPNPVTIALDHGFFVYQINDRWEVGHEMAPGRALRTA